MNTSMPLQQRGLSFGGFVIGAFLFVFLGITALKLIPPYLQEAQIKNIFVTMARDPDLQKATTREIQAAFSRRASIDNITAIKADDIDISGEEGKPILSASYSVKIPLVANISVFIEFHPSSAS